MCPVTIRFNVREYFLLSFFFFFDRQFRRDNDPSKFHDTKKKKNTNFESFALWKLESIDDPIGAVRLLIKILA